jgi:hypothetical protein
MDLQRELSAVEQVVREKTPSHVMPTIEASIHSVKESGLRGALYSRERQLEILNCPMQLAAR